MSLRKILIGLGLLVALLPYLGFPSWIDTMAYTLAGLAIVLLLTVFHKQGAGRGGGAVRVQEEEKPRTLPTQHGEVEVRPSLGVAKESESDAEKTRESVVEKTSVENKTTTSRTRKQRNGSEPSQEPQL